jgi:hypothetical protein
MLINKKVNTSRLGVINCYTSVLKRAGIVGRDKRATIAIKWTPFIDISKLW